MNSLDRLKTYLNNNELIKRYQHLDKIINSNKEYKKNIDIIKNLQKKYVRTLDSSVKKDIDIKIKEFMDNPLILEYLNLIDEINNLLNNISEIISNELNI